ncbi:hypothetical protein [Streptomyces olivochromogenes]|uniref:hypothetical protein n=1 Tax=Streptomyces olivochromogenes TaxID=1963 RepID=UPI0007489DF1|nr:hypothetical protein [Streptomyces olivochromogenes]KUN42623.1 hypothetical protein AQJ27_35645 [Streptomyces olivochromogenes]
MAIEARLESGVVGTPEVFAAAVVGQQGKCLAQGGEADRDLCLDGLCLVLVALTGDLVDVDEGGVVDDACSTTLKMPMWALR